MLFGTGGLLGGVIGPVIDPAVVVLAVSSRSGAKAKAGGSGGKAAPLRDETAKTSSAGAITGPITPPSKPAVPINIEAFSNLL